MDNLQLKRYKIEKKIGEGGMADVYLAFDQVLNRHCAIKILRSQLSNDPIAKLRFTREADAASGLQHPNIVQIYDVGQSEQRPFIVMEYVNGESLKSLIFKRGAIEQKEAVFLMTQIVEALACAHKAGIIHRDLKPQNILVKPDGTAKITDFGIASMQGAVQLTQHDSVMGSVHYLAPECARGAAATPASDLYSLGIVFYEMLCGDVPFKGEGAMQIAMAHLQQDMPDIRQKNKTVPQSLANIITKATAKNTSLRYQTADQMLEDLRGALDPSRLNEARLVLSLPESGLDQTKVFSDLPHTDKPVIQKPKINPWFWGLIGVAGVLLLALVGSLLFGGKNDFIHLIDVENMTVAQAAQVIEGQGLSLDPVYQYEDHTTIEEGRVVRSIPEANSPVFKGDKVKLVLSKGVFFVVGNYRNMTVDEVRQDLRKAPKVSIKVEYEQDDSVEEGHVIRQENLLPGDSVDPNRLLEIKLVVARPLSFEIPKVVGQDVEEAQRLLESKGAKVILKELDPSTLNDKAFAEIEMGKVHAVNPAEGQPYTQTDGAVIELEYYRKIDRDQVNKKPLALLLEEVERLRTEGVILGFGDQFAIDNAKGAAQTVYDNPQASQSEVDAVYKQLKKALDEGKKNSGLTHD